MRAEPGGRKPWSGTGWGFDRTCHWTWRCERAHTRGERGSNAMPFPDRHARPALRAEAVAPTRRGLLALGCAAWLEQRHGARVVMSGADWHMTETGLEFDVPQWGRPPRRDVVVEDGDAIRLGDTAVEVLLTPGHTPGTISLLFDVRDGQRTHRALLWGGTAFNFGRRPERMRASP